MPFRFREAAVKARKADTTTAARDKAVQTGDTASAGALALVTGVSFHAGIAVDRT